MPVKVFVLKSLFIQNVVMGSAICIVLFLLYRGVKKKKIRQILLSVIWFGAVIWFFNSSLWGFSAVTIGNKGIGLKYGFLSFKDTTLPLNTSFEIKIENSGFPKYRKLYVLKIGKRDSMRLSGLEYSKLQYITESLKKISGR